MSNRKEKKEENTEGTQTSKHPNGYSPLEVFEKVATKKDDHNHPNSLQRITYRKENVNILSKWKRFVHTRLFVVREPATLIGKDPWPAFPEGLLKIKWQLLCAGRKTNQVTAPVARSITEAAPHTRIPHPFFPQSDSLTNKRHYRKA